MGAQFSFRLPPRDYPNSLSPKKTFLVDLHGGGHLGLHRGLHGMYLLPVLSHPWSHIALDFVTGLPPSQGNTVILTIVNRFSKAVHFVALYKLPSANETADLLVLNVVRLRGIPLDIVSDQG